VLTDIITATVASETTEMTIASTNVSPGIGKKLIRKQTEMNEFICANSQATFG